MPRWCAECGERTRKPGSTRCELCNAETDNAFEAILEFNGMDESPESLARQAINDYYNKGV